VVVSVVRTFLSSLENVVFGGSSVTPCNVIGASWKCVVQYCDPKVTVFDANCNATSCNHNNGIPRTVGLCPNFVANIGNWPS